MRPSVRAEIEKDNEKWHFIFHSMCVVVIPNDVRAFCVIYKCESLEFRDLVYSPQHTRDREKKGDLLNRHYHD